MDKNTIIYIDMDDTICEYIQAHKKCRLEKPNIMYPQSIPGFFLNLKPIEKAVESVNLLRSKFKVFILTRPSYQNPLCYTEKRLWIENHFDLKFCDKLILSPDKSLLNGDFLIDDVIWEGFKGEQIHYGSSKYNNWEEVLKRFNI